MRIHNGDITKLIKIGSLAVIDKPDCLYAALELHSCKGSHGAIPSPEQRAYPAYRDNSYHHKIKEDYRLWQFAVT